MWYAVTALVACAERMQPLDDGLTPANRVTPGVVAMNSFCMWPDCSGVNDKSQCSLLLTAEEARAASSALEQTWDHQDRRPFALRGRRAPPKRSIVSGNPDDAISATSQTNGVDTVTLRLSPQGTTMHIRTGTLTQTYRICSNEISRGRRRILWMTELELSRPID